MDYEILVQEEGTNPRTHFLNVLQKLTEADTDLVLRLEDDCFEINHHIKHNLLTWPAVHEHRFGVGWGFRPGGRANHAWHRGELHGSLCTLFWRKDLPWIIDAVDQWFYKNPTGAILPQDTALSQVVTHAGKHIALHNPSLVENNVHIPSTLGNLSLHHHTSGRTFKKEWRRG